MFDVKKVIEEAKNEVAADAMEKAKAKIKEKLRDLVRAKKITANIERELEDLYTELGQDGGND